MVVHRRCRAFVAFQCVDYMAIPRSFFFFMSSFDDIAVGASSERIGVFGNTVSLAGYGALYPYSLFSRASTDPETAWRQRPRSSSIDFAYNIVHALSSKRSTRTGPCPLRTSLRLGVED